jgi:hypothetical protein
MPELPKCRVHAYRIWVDGAAVHGSPFTADLADPGGIWRCLEVPFACSVRVTEPPFTVPVVSSLFSGPRRY